MKHRLFSVGIALMLCLSLVTGCTDSTASESSSASQTVPTPTQADTVLMVSGDNGDTEYSVEALEALGTETYSYSGRTQDAKNTRVIREFTGVALETVLKDAGYDPNTCTMKVICSDGYSREYETAKILKLTAFANDTDTVGSEVPALLSIVHEGDDIGHGNTYSADAGSPIRLVYGQADYDCNETQDFNMQGWASFVEVILVTNEAA